MFFWNRLKIYTSIFKFWKGKLKIYWRLSSKKKKFSPLKCDPPPPKDWSSTMTYNISPPSLYFWIIVHVVISNNNFLVQLLAQYLFTSTVFYNTDVKFFIFYLLVKTTFFKCLIKSTNKKMIPSNIHYLVHSIKNCTYEFQKPNIFGKKCTGTNIKATF